jgi:hypothetical protein
MNNILGVNVLKSYPTAEFPLGTLAQVDGTIYEFAGSTSGIAAYKLSAIDEDGNAALAGYSATIPRKLGVPQAAIAATEYGWFARQGNFTINALASCAIDVKLYTSATPGSVDDAASSQNLISGLRINTAAGAGGAADVPASASVLISSFA